MTEIDTGLMLRNYFEKKRIRKSGLARKAGINYTTLLRQESLKTTDTATLLKICHALGHNFFLDMAGMLPENYTTEAETGDNSTEVISELEKKIIALEAQNELLLNLVKNRMQ